MDRKYYRQARDEKFAKKKLFEGRREKIPRERCVS
jgi:hypothetical protein